MSNKNSTAYNVCRRVLVGAFRLLDILTHAYIVLYILLYFTQTPFLSIRHIIEITKSVINFCLCVCVCVLVRVFIVKKPTAVYQFKINLIHKELSLCTVSYNVRVMMLIYC